MCQISKCCYGEVMDVLGGGTMCCECHRLCDLIEPDVEIDNAINMRMCENREKITNSIKIINKQTKKFEEIERSVWDNEECILLCKKDVWSYREIQMLSISHCQDGKRKEIAHFHKLDVALDFIKIYIKTTIRSRKSLQENLADHFFDVRSHAEKGN